MRDITLEETVYFRFTTRAFATGVPTQLAGSPVLSVLESNNNTPITAGVSVAVDRASVTGLNEATVVATAANGYEAGKSHGIYISTGTVGGVSVVGEVVAEFTVQASAAFKRLGAPAGASTAADIAAIKSDSAAVKTQTDKMAFTVTNQIDANVLDWKSSTAPAMTGDAYARIGAAGAGLTAVTGATLSAAYDAAKTAAQAGDAMALTAGERNSTADALLNRDMSTGTDSGSTTVRTMRQALRFLRNKWSISGTTLSVCKEDDATSSWTSTVTTTNGADPVTANDPAGP